jgi:hypothetical protein
MDNYDDTDPGKEEAAPAKVAALKMVRDKFSGTASETQRQRLRAAFEIVPKISTQEARQYLDMLHPAGRVKELREEGFNILTLWTTVETDAGCKHRVADYLWVREASHA